MYYNVLCSNEGLKDLYVVKVSAFCIAVFSHKRTMFIVTAFIVEYNVGYMLKNNIFCNDEAP